MYCISFVLSYVYVIVSMMNTRELELDQEKEDITKHVLWCVHVHLFHVVIVYVGVLP